MKTTRYLVSIRLQAIAVSCASGLTLAHFATEPLLGQNWRESSSSAMLREAGDTRSEEGLSDREIVEAVLNALGRDRRVGAHHIRVEARDSTVRLLGEVETLLARDRAANLAGVVRGVRGVINDLKVASVRRSDAELERELNRSLQDHPTIGNQQVSVEVRNGSAVLFGTVDSWAQFEAAESVAKAVPGVREFTNQLIVRPERSRPDSEIAADVRTRLSEDAFLADNDINVRVEDGRVIIRGAVGSDLERDLALTKARVLNARAVDAQDLRVVPSRAASEWPDSTRLSDEEIAQAIEQLFRRHPFFSPAEVDVRVENGRVTLTGLVDSPEARMAAVREAWRVEGVRDVRSFVRTAPPEPPERFRRGVGASRQTQTGRAADVARAPGDQEVAAIAALFPTQGNTTRGTIFFIREPQGIRLSGQITGLQPGEHGFHVHEHGDCSAPDASSAGDHFNPTGQPHGAQQSGQRHVGDLGNITAGPDGVAHVSLVDMVIKLQGLHSVIGKALVVHAGSDDMTSQPSGNAGGRVACGIIQAQPGIHALLHE